MGITAPSPPAKSWRDVLPIHPAAELFPMMSEPELKELGEDIKKNRLKTSIAIFDSGFDTKGHRYWLLDGRNRLAAMEAVGLAPRLALKTLYRGAWPLWTLTLEGVGWDDVVSQPKCVADDPYAFVISANIHRRHLTSEQKRDLVAKLIKQQPNKSDRQIAEQAKSNRTTVGQIRKGLENAGDVSIVDTRTDSRGRQQPASKPRQELPDEPAEPVARGEREILEAAKQIRAEKTAARHAEWTAKTIEISKQNAPLPCDRKYPVILADPPWKFEAYDAESGMERAAETHYPTLTIDEICALPVADLATTDAVLFLWCTSPHLPDALRVVESWGFSYRANIVWVKQGPPGLGYWVRNQHEILLIAARGNMRAPLESDRPPSVIHAPRREHSRKPDEAYEAIERMYRDLPKTELFARRERPGWDRWGNEAPAADDSNEIPSPAAAPANDDLAIFDRRRPAP
jgi:N6-adenosine-specific RNA methylase IME4